MSAWLVFGALYALAVVVLGMWLGRVLEARHRQLHKARRAA